jgi:hypothetical protein
MGTVELAMGNPGVRLLVLALISSLIWPLALERLGLYASQRLQNLPRVLTRLAAAGALATLVQCAAAFVVSAPVTARGRADRSRGLSPGDYGSALRACSRS